MVTPGLLVACLEGCRIGGRLSASAVADVLDWVGPVGSTARVALEAAAAIGPTFDTSDLAGQLGLSPRTIQSCCWSSRIGTSYGSSTRRRACTSSRPT